MKLKHMFIILGLALGLGVGVAAGIGGTRQMKAARAYDKDTVYYYLTGNFDGEDHWTDYIAAPSDGKDAGVLLNQSLSAGDKIKFKQAGSWTDPLSFGSFNSAAGAYNAFCWNYGDDNTYVAVTGVYNFYIYEDGGDMKVSAEFAETNTATYSYVLTSNSTLGHMYVWNGDVKLRDWGSAPAVGQAYDVKFTYSEFDYYGLYRIDDRILAGWPNLIMKDSKSEGAVQSDDIARTAGNKQELYMCGASVVTKAKSTDEYKAVEFLYNLVSHRGEATYKAYDFAFSICATSAEDAYYLVAAYDGFSSAIKTLLAAAQFQTYDVSGVLAEGTKAWADIDDMVDALRPIAAGYTPKADSRGFMNSKTESGRTTIIIISVSVATVLVIAGFYFYRRRKLQ